MVGFKLLYSPLLHLDTTRAAPDRAPVCRPFRRPHVDGPGNAGLAIPYAAFDLAERREKISLTSPNEARKRHSCLIVPAGAVDHVETRTPDKNEATVPAIAIASWTYALWVSPTGRFRLLDWGTVTTPQHALGCDTAQPLGLTLELTMWMDEEAIPLRRPRNARASELLRAYQPHPGLHFGDVVFTGAADTSTDTVQGLTEDQALSLLDLYLLRITARVPGARLH